MAPDHLFIDGLGCEFRGRETMRGGWKRYFALFPNYHIEVREMLHRDQVVGLFGTTSGTYASDACPAAENSWQVPAAWEAVVREAAVAVWRVYADIDPVRQIMSRSPPGKGLAP
ncbi:MAG: nuclear transport factor 2 family protein [Gemmatimonadota bacterium]